MKVSIEEDMAKYIAQIAVISVQIISRAIGRTLKAELSMIQETVKNRGEWLKIKTNPTNFTLEDAMKILNVDKLDPEKIRKSYVHHFDVNNKTKGSLLHLQSKIFRAKERIDMEMRSK